MKLPSLILVMAGMLPAGLHAGPSDAAIQLRGELTAWPAPPRPSNRKQTAEEEESGRRFGRALPTPELMQPLLDPALPHFQARDGLALSGNFKGMASDTMPALVALWIAAFKKYHPNVNVAVAPPYDGAVGAAELAKGSIDVAFISRVLKPDEIASFKNSFAYAPLSVPVAGGSCRHFGFLDALGFFVHPDNPLQKISYEQLDAIYSRTHHRGAAPITTWGQLGLTGEWARKPIHAYGVKPWDGTEDLIREKVLSYQGNRGDWREDIQFSAVFPIARRVAEDRAGIGYTGLSYIDASLKMLAVGESPSGPFYPPDCESVANTNYPLGRLIYFNVNKAPTRPLDPALEELLRFILSAEGQQIVRDHAIFLPLRAAQAGRSRALLGEGR